MKIPEIQTLINESKNIGTDWHETANLGKFEFTNGVTVITATKKEDQDFVRGEAKTLKVNVSKFIFNEDDAQIMPEPIGRFKADEIRKEKIDLYLENDPAVVYWIKKFNPKANVLYINQLNYIIFSYNLDGFAYALRLKEEGNQVVIALMEPEDVDIKIETDSQKELDRRRRMIGDGLIKKFPAKQVFEFLMKNADMEDYFVDFDFNKGAKFSEPLEKKGYSGLFPKELDLEMEKDRQKAQEFVRANYPDLAVSEEMECKTIEEAIKHISETQKVYVVKANNEDITCYVPQTDDPVQYAPEVEGFLNENKEGLEKEGFILQEKISQPVEVTPEAMYRHGAPLYFMADIENKKLGSGDIGQQTGCSQDLNFVLNPDCQLAKTCLEPYYPHAEKENKNNLMDASALIDRENDKPYFGEFCSGRKGYNTILTEISMLTSASLYFESLKTGINPFMMPYAKKFAASIRIFNLLQDEDRYTKGELAIQAEGPNVWLFDAMLTDNQLVNIGQSFDLAIVTGAGDSPEEAIDNCLKNISNISVQDQYWRSDLTEKEKWFGLLNRYYYLKEHNWLQ